MGNILDRVEEILKSSAFTDVGYNFTVEKGFGEPETAYKSDTAFIMFNSGTPIESNLEKTATYQQSVSIHLYDKITLTQANEIIKLIIAECGAYTDSNFTYSTLNFEGLENNSNNLFGGNSILKINLKGEHWI